MQNNPNDNTNTMTVDIRLCGNIPRNEMKARFGAPCPTTALTSRTERLSTACLAETNGYSTLRKTTLFDHRSLSGLIIRNTVAADMTRGILTEKQLPLSPVLEPPSWAVPASGETWLEPIGDSQGRQTSIDLTSRKSFKIGRSPNCDVQLMHATSSRRHSMLFHHSNGSCYVVDCGSAHGTFVNGKRITPPAESGVVVPHKVRRGALIRFGGPGAPCFVLKSLPVHLHNIKADSKLSSEAFIVLSNTRKNALGKVGPDVLRSNIVTSSMYQALAVARKRSFDSLSGETLDFDSSDSESDCKRLRCSSPPLSPEAPLRLVSPDLPAMIKPRRVTFAINDTFYYPPTVSPDESGDEDDDALV